MENKRRLHIHISVENIEESVKFYNLKFRTIPKKIKKDYVQWLVDDLSLNFAISTRGYDKGINHLGIQYESNEALEDAELLFEEAGIKGEKDKSSECCYKKSNKYWLRDPTGIIWENYHSMEDIKIFGLDSKETNDGCCLHKVGIFSANKNYC